MSDISVKLSWNTPVLKPVLLVTCHDELVGRVVGPGWSVFPALTILYPAARPLRLPSCKPDNQTDQTHIPASMTAKMLLLLALLVSHAVGLPQKVVFRPLGREGSEEGCDGRHEVRTNGDCYTVGEQGPCEEGELLDMTGGCVKTQVTNTATTTTNPTIAANELGCPGDQIPFEGGCHQLASTGPCQPGHWLLLVEVKDGQVVAECQERKCKEETEVWWQPSCSCIGNATVRTGLNPCGDDGQLMVSPYGKGVCSYPEEQDSEQSNFKTRIFENIPVNDETAFSRATLLNCYVDEANNCRRIFTLGPQPAQNQARQGFQITLEDSPSTNPADTLIEWLEKFEKEDGDCPASVEDDTVETA